MRGLILSAALGAAALGGCYTQGEVGYTAGYSGTVYASTPDLVTVGPGVQVVADYDEPVFYSDGFYWRFYNGGWYRSNNYATGWFYVDSPPIYISRIDRPYAYVHYRPRGYVARSNVRYRPAEPIVRDHRTYQQVQPAPGRPPVYTSPSSPTVVRDHRGPAVQAPPPRAPAAAPVRDHRAPPPKDDRDVRDHRH